jgi:hypothetical protein
LHTCVIYTLTNRVVIADVLKNDGELQTLSHKASKEWTVDHRVYAGEIQACGGTGSIGKNTSKAIQSIHCWNHVWFML